MFDKIITVTCNPAFDITLKLASFVYDEPNAVEDEQVFSGGKGVNVSKVLSVLGYDSIATGFVGEKSYDRYVELLCEERIKQSFVKTNGITRENFTMILPNGAQVKINRNGDAVLHEDWDTLLARIVKQFTPYQKVLVVFAGSIPLNTDKEDYVKFITKIKSDNVSVAIDSSLLDFSDYKQIKPFIIKPNFNELKRIMNINLRSESALIRCVEELSEHVDHAIVSLGAKGLVYKSGLSMFRANVPKVKVLCTVGAGDSSLAGFIAGLQGGLSPADTIRLAAGCGTAAVMTEGTKSISMADIDELQDQITVVKLKG